MADLLSNSAAAAAASPRLVSFARACPPLCVWLAPVRMMRVRSSAAECSLACSVCAHAASWAAFSHSELAAAQPAQMHRAGANRAHRGRSMQVGRVGEVGEHQQGRHKLAARLYGPLRASRLPQSQRKRPRLVSYFTVSRSDDEARKKSLGKFACSLARSQPAIVCISTLANKSRQQRQQQQQQ